VLTVQERKPFEYKEEVLWGEVAVVLATLFLQNTGRELDKDQLRYLARTAFSTFMTTLTYTSSTYCQHLSQWHL